MWPMRAEAINGGLSRYRAARCMYRTSAGGGDCLVSTDDGYTSGSTAELRLAGGRRAGERGDRAQDFTGRASGGSGDLQRISPLTSERHQLLKGRPPGGLDRPHLLGQRQSNALLGVSGLVDEHGNIAGLAIETLNRGQPLVESSTNRGSSDARGCQSRPSRSPADRNRYPSRLGRSRLQRWRCTTSCRG